MNVRCFVKRFFALAAICGIFLFVFCACTSTDERSNAESQPPVSAVNEDATSNDLVSAGGSYASDGDFVYFINTNDGSSLCRMTLAGSDQIQLDDTECSTLFLDNEFIFYNSRIRDASLRTSPFPSLCRMRLDGSERTELVKEAAIDGVTDERIIFRDIENNLKTIKKDGTDETLLIPNATDNDYMKVTSKYIFYSNLRDDDTHGLYRINIDGSGLVKVSDDYATWTNIFDDKIYYVNESGNLVVIDLEGNSKETISEGNFGRIVVVDDWVYFADYDADTNNLCKIKHDGTEKVVLFEGNVSQISVIEETVFFTSYSVASDGATTDKIEYCIQSDGSDLKKLTD